ncbi:hypothetical protein CDV31_001463 [Fusarium ambrosium]|uniref:Uncharacterized protein n=1 Tax=Fusarium ambrosium TaxID=131363 RepID=A0A428UZC0_9HYPO|nr:hypothetical protein CDV31_001463 [Fusarium ambrosium]
MVKILPPPKPDIPEPEPGMALSLFPSGHYLWLDDFEYYDQLGRDPLQQAKLWLITDQEERVAKLKEVLENYPKQVHRRSMLYDAAKRGDEALVRHLVATGLKVHPDIPEGPQSEEEAQADQEARENGSIPDKDDPSVTPVHVAALYGHVGCLGILLEQGNTDVDVRDKSGRPPLILGAKHPEVVRYLLGKGADPTARANSECGNGNALEFAADNAAIESVKLILEHPIHSSTKKRKSTTDEEPEEWVTPLAIKAAAKAPKARNGKTKGELLSKQQREAIVEAIPEAAMAGSIEALKLLLSYQYPTDLDGEILPFDIPEELHKPFVYGAYGAMEHNSPDKFEFINSFGIIEHDTMSLDKLPQGQTLNLQHLLDQAAGAGSIDSARLMIERYGADPNKHRMPPGMKPLYMAAANDKPEMVRFLLESHGADVHAGNGRFATGPTALWIAVVLKSMESIRLLLQHGGPVDHIDEKIRNISGPMTVVLKADREDSGSASSVRLETQETAKAYLEKYKGNFQNLNPPFVLLEIGPEDKDWIDKLQARRSAKELAESGDNARELDEETGVKEEELSEDDPRKLSAPFPTITEREDELLNDDDLIPKFVPFLVPAGQ